MKIWTILILAVMAMFLVSCAGMATGREENYAKCTRNIDEFRNKCPRSFVDYNAKLYSEQTSSYTRQINQLTAERNQLTKDVAFLKEQLSRVPGSALVATPVEATISAPPSTIPTASTATALAGAPSEQIVSFTMKDGTKLPLVTEIGQPAQLMLVKIGGQYYHAGAKIGAPLPRTDVVASITTAAGKTIPVDETETIGYAVKGFVKLKGGIYEVTVPTPSSEPLPPDLNIGLKSVFVFRDGEWKYIYVSDISTTPPTEPLPPNLEIGLKSVFVFRDGEWKYIYVSDLT